MKTIRTTRRMRQTYSVAHLEQNSNCPGLKKIINQNHFRGYFEMAWCQIAALISLCLLGVTHPKAKFCDQLSFMYV